MTESQLPVTSDTSAMLGSGGAISTPQSDKS